MIASLMMYDRPELSAATTAYWGQLRAALAERGIAAPVDLANDRPEAEVWQAPDLVFSQTCGMPYRTQLAEHVTLIGTPDFGLEHCPPGYYNSAVIVRADDPRSLAGFAGARFAYNQTCSQSGYAAAYVWARAQGFWFEQRQASGGHRQSARMVAEGRADIATIDAQTWRLIRRFDGFAKDLRVLDWTVPTPGLPYISAKGADGQAMFDAVQDAIATLDSRHRAALDLRGIVRVPHDAYMAVENPPA